MTGATDTPLGVVLAGGKSTRLGRDKAWLRFGDRPLLRQVAELLAQVTGDILIAGRDPLEFGLEAPWLPDVIENMGPAGGVLTVLAATGRPCLILSCDLPFLDAATLDRLVAVWRRRPDWALMTTYRIRETGYIESLVAVYEPGGAALVRQNLARGERRLSAIFPEQQRLHLDYSREDTALARAFFNINSPPDLMRARSMEGPA